MMQPRLLLIASLFASVVAASENRGFPPFSIDGTATFLYRQFDYSFLENDREQKDRWELHNPLVLNFTRSRFLVGLQVDVDRFDARENDIRLEKRYLEYRGSSVTCTAGDFFSSFGRGTALSIVKTHELYGLENQIDNTIDGARFRFSGRTLRTELLGGSVHDDVTGQTDSLFGGTASYSVSDWLRFGGSTVLARMQWPDPDERLAGGLLDISNLSRSVNLYGEFTRLKPERDFANGADRGRADYVQFTGQKWGLALTAEHKVLKNFFFAYSTPPILEDESQALLADFFAVYPEDLQATKVRGDRTLPDGTIVYGAFAHFNERASRHPSYHRYHRVISEMYFGGERLFDNGIHIQADAGRRQEDSTGYFFQFNGPTLHGAVSLSVPVHSVYSAQVDYQRSQLRGDFVQYRRNKLGITFACSGLFSIMGTWESSNLPGEIFAIRKENFYGWQLEVKLKQHVLRIFHGQTRGGQKCSGSVCKYVPAFGGTRVEATVRF